LQEFQDSKLNVFFEGTLGAGGHASAILEQHPEIATYIGCDQDQSAIEIAKERLESWESKIRYVHSNFAEIDAILNEQGVDKVDGFFLT